MKIFSRKADRKALREALDYCREGDVLVVARLDRLGRSLRELIDQARRLKDDGTKQRRALPKPPASTRNASRMVFEGDPRWHGDDME